MRLHDLAKELKLIADRGGGFGSDTEDALNEVAELLNSQPDGPISDLRRLLGPKPAPAQKKATSVNDALVQTYVSRLEQSESVVTAEGVWGELVSDKKVKVAEAIAIAQRYTGAKKSFKSKVAAFDAIKDLFRRKAWDKGALDIIKAQAVR